MVVIASLMVLWRFAVRTEAQRYAGKIVIRWATDQNPARIAQIKEFERLHPEIHITWDPGSSDTAKKMIQISGRRGPDLFDIYDSATFHQFAASGALYDFTELRRKDVRKTLEKNGELHIENTRLEKELGIASEDGSLTNFGEPGLEGDSARGIYQYNEIVLALNERFKERKFHLLEYPLVFDIFWPGIKDMLVYDGKLLAVPTNAAPTLITYNKDVFDRYGVPYPEGEWTTEEFLQTCRRLSRKKKGTNRYESFAIAPDIIADSFLYPAGGRVFSPDKTGCILDSPEGVKAYTVAGQIYSPLTGYPRLAPSGADSLAGTTSVSTWPNLIEGRIAMMAATRWPLCITGPSFNYGIAPFPYFPDTPADKRKINAIGRATAVSRDTRHPEAAFKFLKFLTSREYNRIVLAGGDGVSGVRYYRDEPWALFDGDYPEVSCRMCARIRERARALGQDDPLKGLTSEEMIELARKEWQDLPKSEKEKVREEISAEMRLIYRHMDVGLLAGFNPYLSPSKYQLYKGLIYERVQNGKVKPEQWAVELAALYKRQLSEALKPDPGMAARYAWANRYGWVLLAVMAALAILFAIRWKRKRAKPGEVRYRRKESLVAFAFLAPNFIGFLIFMLFPVVFSLIIAFTNCNTLSNQFEYVGFKNFVDILSNRDFYYFAFNTFCFMLGLPISMALSLALAIVLSNKLRGYIAFRTTFYLPSVVSGVAIFLMWKWIYHGDYGLLNRFLQLVMEKVSLLFTGDASSFAVEWPRWLTGEAGLFGISFFWAKPALIAMGVWTAMGGPNMLLYLAGLTAIPPELYEAASVDGAGAWQRFKHITWPLLAPTTFFIFVMGLIGALQGGFEMAYVMTRGGPEQSTTTMGYYIYNSAFFEFRMGHAAGAAWILFLMIFAMTLVNWRYGQKAVHYE